MQKIIYVCDVCGAESTDPTDVSKFDPYGEVFDLCTKCKTVVMPEQIRDLLRVGIRYIVTGE